jgi:S-adenosylmethionine hydrolase
VHIDRFGNMITNITTKELQPLIGERTDLGIVTVTVSGKEIKGLKRFYAESAPGQPGALMNGSGSLEIFLYKQNARTALSAKRGEGVRVIVAKA